MTYDGYVNDGMQHQVTDDTVENVQVDGELKSVADNYSMSIVDDQNDCERHYQQKKKTDDKPFAHQNDLVAENKYRLGGSHDAGMGVVGWNHERQIWYVLFPHDDC